MRVEQLKLVSFKGFRDFTLECSPFTCLVGLNSSGKTSILQAIQLLWDLVVFSFGNKDRPDFTNVRWQANPSTGLSRLSYADPEAVWLHKRTSEPCCLLATLSGGVEVDLEIPGPRRYELVFCPVSNFTT